MKRRLITAVLVYPVLLLFSALIACNLHLLFSGGPVPVWRPAVVLDALLHAPGAQRFFLVFAGISLLLELAALLSSVGVQYRNAVRRVTPQITIPEASGRGEYGTARFMTKRELRKLFSPGRLRIRSLLKEVKQREKTKTPAGRSPAGLEE